MRHTETRRDFARMTLAGALAANSVLSGAKAKLESWPPGIKLSVQSGSDPSEEDLQFVRQLGVGYVNLGARGATATAENFLRLRQKVEGAGLKVWNIGNTDVHNMEEVTLNLPGRDAKIEEYLNYIRNLGAAGIHYSTYAHMGNGIEHRPRGDPRRRPVARLSCRGGERRPLGGPGLARPTDPRPRIFGARDLGQL